MKPKAPYVSVGKNEREVWEIPWHTGGEAYSIDADGSAPASTAV